MHNLARTAEQPDMPLPMDAGTYSNHCNVLQGHLRTLGLERRQNSVRSLHEMMRSGSAA